MGSQRGHIQVSLHFKIPPAAHSILMLQLANIQFLIVNFVEMFIAWTPWLERRRHHLLPQRRQQSWRALNIKRPVQ